MILRDSGDRNGTESFIGREEIPLSPGKNRPVGHERRKGKLFQAAADIPLVFRKKDGLFQRGGAEISVIKRFLHTDRKKFKKDLFQFRRVDGTPVGRESDKKPGHDLFVRDLAGGPGEDLLAAAADRDQAAFAPNLSPGM